MSIHALITGRAGSVGVPGKNIRSILGKPLVAYPIEAALKCKALDSIHVVTDCPTIKMIAKGYGAGVISLPKSLATPEAELAETIKYAQAFVKADVLVTMHANCGIHREGLVDECLAKLISNPDADACVSANVIESLHPYRQKRVCEDGSLVPWLDVPKDTTNNRQSIGAKSVSLDGACRVFRAKNLERDGQPPFRYLGERILWVENKGGRDVGDEDDVVLTERWLSEDAWRRSKGV